MCYEGFDKRRVVWLAEVITVQKNGNARGCCNQGCAFCGTWEYLSIAAKAAKSTTLHTSCPPVRKGLNECGWKRDVNVFVVRNVTNTATTGISPDSL